ncbi:BadF/BadG/BcrA/BcrD ATPase family protein [Nocardiopsis trehalosi]|uniref:BadF/BadG/BcrA/BcrD ATPase family protein n=1 Tax=Nocardiopsis trehalosi TaxID=109329 RepID=UPI00083327D5|nr:BadF/BadG/BcrA/BcrD ATPase family protein [Nocardiopsis trehalosi]
MNQDAVIGVDAGGTSTRCAVAALDGRILGYGTAGGANQFSSADPAAAFRTALRAALGGAAGAGGDSGAGGYGTAGRTNGLDGRSGVRIVGAVFGVAGASSAPERAEELAGRAWADVGLPGAPRVIDDIAVAFAAGSAAPEGAVLIAGTGAVAARVRDGAVVRRCDGHGWLLGDEGSAVWLGVAGLRAALAAADGRGPATVLGDRLAAALGVAPGDTRRIVRAAHERPPAELGRLAPEVTGAAAAGDAVAGGLVADAAHRLLAALDAVAPAAGAPVVVAGALLADGPVAEAVRGGIRERRGADPLPAADGALGAAGLALRRTGAPASAHAALLHPGTPA